MGMKPKTAKGARWADHYTRNAQKERFAARSVYKLKEIQKKYRVIRPGDKVLDLGCAPGSWLQYAAQLTGPTGTVVGIDRQPVKIALPDHVHVQEMDILLSDIDWPSTLGSDFDAVISDMAPATTGNKHVDTARSMELCQSALSIALQCLKTRGHFICKLFHGVDFQQFNAAVKQHFKRLQRFKPQSSRKASKEIYLIGLGKR